MTEKQKRTLYSEVKNEFIKKYPKSYSKKYKWFVDKKMEEKFHKKVLKKLGTKEQFYFNYFELGMMEEEDSYLNYNSLYELSVMHKDYAKQDEGFAKHHDYKDETLILQGDYFMFIGEHDFLIKGEFLSLYEHLLEVISQKITDYIDTIIPSVFKNSIVRKEEKSVINGRTLYTMDLEKKVYGKENELKLLTDFHYKVLLNTLKEDFLDYSNRFKVSTFIKQDETDGKEKEFFYTFIVSNNETAKMIKTESLIKDFYTYEESYVIVENLIQWYFHNKAKKMIDVFCKENSIKRNRGIEL